MGKLSGGALKPWLFWLNMCLSLVKSPLSWLLLSSDGGTISIGPGAGGIHGCSGGGWWGGGWWCIPPHSIQNKHEEQIQISLTNQVIVGPLKRLQKQFTAEGGHHDGCPRITTATPFYCGENRSSRDLDHIFCTIHIAPACKGTNLVTGNIREIVLSFSLKPRLIYQYK